MKFSFFAKTAVLIVGLSLCFGASPAQAKTHHHTKHHGKHHAGGMVDSSASYADIVMNAETGRILHASNPDSLRHPASLTKMMTLYVTFQALESGHLQLNQYLPISSYAAEQSPSKLGLHAGQRIRVEDAILGLVTVSANDAAMVLAEGQGGTAKNFALMMTRQARALGMSRTRFDNPNGLPDPDQVTTARDMAVLGHALIYHFPQFYPYFSHDSFTYAGLNHPNHNHLMERYDGMDGIKTGYIRASGFNLVASAVHGHTRLIGVVFGGKSAVARDNHMAQLLDQGFVLAQQEEGSQHIASNTGIEQGDSADKDDAGEYVTLPAKFAPAAATQTVALKQPIPRPDAVKISAISGTGWGIQIGAYNDPEISRQALSGIVSTLPQMLGTAEPQVEKVAAGKAVMYRARLMSLDQRTAQAACDYLTQHAQNCLTVGP